VAPSALTSRFDEGTAGSDTSDRVLLWKSAIAIGGERPVVGAGIGNFPEAYAGVRGPDTTGGDRPLLNQGDGETLPFHAHNAFLTVLAEQGVLGLGALLVLGALALGSALATARGADPLARLVGLASGAGLAVWGVGQLVNVNLYEPAVLPLFCLVGLASSLARGGRRKPSAQGGRRAA
ncbi:MAG: O-antigen ligase family protein, partial [Solirubrobacterales bacterium]|nr:O-antigen ligase family protein [Solirubrobacterales bacterium]